jgi:hypothetical protein
MEKVVDAGDERGFVLSKEELVKIMMSNQERTFAEEIDLIEQHGGVEAVVAGFRGDLKGGILENEMALR